jgi:ribosome-associated toxin RatA of RatAB toxin-antitoxin module
VIQVRRTLAVERDAATVFALISDAARYPEFFAGITKWEPRSRKRRGVGARFRVLMKVGSIEAGGTVVVEQWEDERLIAWRSEAGLRQSGRWELEPTDTGAAVTLELEYDLSGGPVGWLVERLVASIVGRNLLATLLAARRMLEFEQSDGESEEEHEPATRGGS